MVWSSLRRHLWQSKRPPFEKIINAESIIFCSKRLKIDGVEGTFGDPDYWLLVVLFSHRRPLPLLLHCQPFVQTVIMTKMMIVVKLSTTLMLISSPLTSCILTLAGSTSFKRPTGAALFVSLSSRAPGPDDEMPSDLT